jgi:glycerol-3-phosphate O-acyltransferase/dihydroxyacetone phosphate acyltransferase
MSVKRRNMLHFTAKSTVFGKKTFAGWISRAVGAVPIQRRRDLPEGVVNNEASMARLAEVRSLVGHSEIFS